MPTMDLDIEMGDPVDGATDVLVEELPRADDILQAEDLEEPGEVVDNEPSGDKAAGCDDKETVVPYKIHISGVHTLHTDDIKSYVKAHFGPVDKIEWIDDGSANLVFGNDYTAGEALTSLSAIKISDATALTSGESLPAKPFNGKPEVSLQVRFSLNSDKKQAGAALRSRYYLLHPEHDPEERRKSQHENRLRYRDRERGYRESGMQCASKDDGQTFEASMYDDLPREHPSRPNLSPEKSATLHASKNRGKELFTNRVQKRNRSASPRRDSDSETHMDALDSSLHENKNPGNLVKSRMTITNSGKELFPTKTAQKGGRLDQLEESIGSALLRDEDIPKVVANPRAQSNAGFNIKGTANQRGSESGGYAIKGAASTNARELFPDKLGTVNGGKGPLDYARSQRRQKAHDLFL